MRLAREAAAVMRTIRIATSMVNSMYVAASGQLTSLVFIEETLLNVSELGQEGAGGCSVDLGEWLVADGSESRLAKERRSYFLADRL